MVAAGEDWKIPFVDININCGGAMPKKNRSEDKRVSKNIRAKQSRALSKAGEEWDDKQPLYCARPRPQYHITDERGNTILRVPGRGRESSRTALDPRR